jgi:plasmid maintenance system antidote protein VapI
MDATNRYLDAVKSRLKLPSDYALAAHWQVTRQRISHYRRGESALSDDRCIEVARILGIPPEQVLFEIQADRARKQGHTGIAEIFERVLKRLAHAPAILAALCLSLCLLTMPKDSYANDGRMVPVCERLNCSSEYLALCQLLRRCFRWLFRAGMGIVQIVSIVVVPTTARL